MEVTNAVVGIGLNLAVGVSSVVLVLWRRNYQPLQARSLAAMLTQTLTCFTLCVGESRWA